MEHVWVWMVHGGLIIAMAGLAWVDWRRATVLSHFEWSIGPAHRSPKRSSVGARPVELHLQQLESNLRGELADSPPGPARVAALNEATSDFEGLIGVARSRQLGWRVCLASGIAGGCLLAARAPTTAAWVICSGAVGGALTWQMGRMADSSLARARERWNGLIRRLGGSFPQGETLRGDTSSATPRLNDDLRVSKHGREVR